MLNLPIHGIEFFSKGKRGVVYTGTYKERKVAIKVKRPTSNAKSAIENEYFWLKKLNPYQIGPKVVFFKNKALVYEFVEGKYILDFLKKASKKEASKILKEVFRQLRIMDKLKVNKKEMHKPLKHIIIGKKVVLLDFERCYKSNKPKNVTQFCQFLLRRKLIKVKENDFIELLKGYKKNLDNKSFNKILRLI